MSLATACVTAEEEVDAEDSPFAVSINILCILFSFPLYQYLCADPMRMTVKTIYTDFLSASLLILNRLTMPNRYDYMAVTQHL